MSKRRENKKGKENKREEPPIPRKVPFSPTPHYLDSPTHKEYQITKEKQTNITGGKGEQKRNGETERGKTYDTSSYPAHHTPRDIKFASHPLIRT
jgi:hypothetical protein